MYRDYPASMASWPSRSSFTTCMWGLSRDHRLVREIPELYSMHMGIIRTAEILIKVWQTQPRIHGDYPIKNPQIFYGEDSTPCIRGLSLSVRTRRVLNYLYPVYTGVILYGRYTISPFGTLPHVYGDYPHITIDCYCQYGFLCILCIKIHRKICNNDMHKVLYHFYEQNI